MEGVWWDAGWMRNAWQGLFHYFRGGNPDRNDESSDDPDTDSDTQSSDYYFEDESSDNDSDEVYHGPPSATDHFNSPQFAVASATTCISNDNWKQEADKLRKEAKKKKKEVCEILTVYTSANPPIKKKTL